MFVARADTAESKPLDLPSGDVLAVSKAGDMLLSLGRRYLTSWTSEGTLARARLFGSSAREVLEHVRDADFLPGDRLAIVRRVNGRDRLEVPQGTVVFETPGYISHVRVSPDGRRVGFLEHPLFGDNRGYVAVYDGTRTRRLTPEYSGVEALAWSADGSEIWYGARDHRIQLADQGDRSGHDRAARRPHRVVRAEQPARARHRRPRARAPDRQRGERHRGGRDHRRRRAIATWPGTDGRYPATSRVTAAPLLLSNQDGTDPDYSVVVRRWMARRR